GRPRSDAHVAAGRPFGSPGALVRHDVGRAARGGVVRGDPMGGRGERGRRARGPLGTFAAMLHLLNHALAKSTMFFLAGRVLHRYRTTEIRGVSGLLPAMPWTGGC